MDRSAAARSSHEARHVKRLPSPFRNILRLSAGDVLAKSLYFLAFVHMARALGVFSYGTLEFAVSVRTYLLLLADGGLELWAVREASKVPDMRMLAARVVPLRFLLASIAFVVLNLSLTKFSTGYADLRGLLWLFGVTLFTQAANLKWVFMGQEKIERVVPGLILGQITFSILIFAFIHDAERVVLVGVLWVIGDLAAVVYFCRLLVRKY
jgi:O-antigen/teichoic acid export membrane protein